jgi:hypothetical protein
MNTLINLVVGAVLASVSLGPAPWVDAGMQLSRAAIVISRLVETSPADHAAASARNAFLALPASTRVRD